MWKCCFAKKQKQQSNSDVIEQSEKGEEIVDRSDTDKLNSNLQHKFCVDFKELIEGYQNEYIDIRRMIENDEDEYIDMSQPRDASYATRTRFNLFTNNRIEIVNTNRLGKDVRLTSAATSYRSMPTEVRGITLRQLRAILPLIKRRCEEEQWTRPVYRKGKETKEKEKVTLENATMYDINKYIIKPFTEFSRKSFVETLPSTKGTQPPRWFVSHYWGETFVHTMACIEQMVNDFRTNYDEEYDRNGGGMTEDTPLWICSFANNQYNLDSDIADDPANTSFAKAMKIANFRVISILDVNNQVYTRLWCMYELYLTLLLSRKQGIDGVLAIYTHIEHEIDDIFERKTAVGLIEGVAKRNWGTFTRQKHFPGERLPNFLSVSIQNAVASKDEDRKHILNSLVGRKGADLDLEPLHTHDNYDKLNDAIESEVFSSQATLNLIYETGETNWNSALSALQKSITKEFRFNPSGVQLFPNEAGAQVFHHLPSGLEELYISGYPHGRVAMDALLDWLENKSTNLKFLKLSNIRVGGEVGGKECGERLTRFLARNDCKIEEIKLWWTDLVGSRNVDTWIECLKKNQSLKKVSLKGMADDVKDAGKKSKYPNTSMELSGYGNRGKIFWDGTTFPDATLSIEQEEVLKETMSKFEGYHPKDSVEDFVLKDSDGKESTS